MKKLNKYLVSHVMKFLVITESAGLVMFITIEFFEHMDLFTSSLNNLMLGMGYITLRIPYYVNLMLPLAFLISILVLIIMMVRNNEIIAARTSGISTVSLMKPLIVFALGLVVFSFVVSEWIMPYTANAADYLYRVKIKKEESHVFFKNDRIWFKRDNVISNIDLFDAKNDTITGLTVMELSDDFTISRRIDARTGAWKGSSWLFSSVVERTFEENAISSKKTYDELQDLIKVSPAALKVSERNPEDMGYKELSKYIRRLKRDGHDVRRYVVDLYNKIAFPFINLIMVFAAFSVGLRYTKTKHIAKGIFSGISVGIFYWFLHSICLSLGYSEIFPPIFAAWLSNMLFFSSGIIGIVTLRT
ncbi:MAG TPA: LPS export ABC transporter permease LptG [Syntrophorhabdus aromaticivorans]|nr:LPS export ABC transporter permease LptG [Syntrophorhabdus aromaticivorans]